MDKTLNRPLFRKKAQELHKIDGKAVPKFFVGGIMSAGNMLRTAAAPAYRYLAPKVSKFMAKPAVQTGVVGLEGYGIGVGSREMAEGVKEGDTGKFLSGASYAVPGMAFLPGSARRSGITALKETGEFMAPRMKDITQKIVANPGKTALASIGTGITGNMISSEEVEAQRPEAMSIEDYQADIQDRLIYNKPEYKPDPKKKVTENLADYRKLEEQAKANPIGIKNPMTEGEKTLNAQLEMANTVNEVAKKLGVEDATTATDEQIKQIAIESNVDEPTLRQMIGKPSGDAGDMPPANSDGVPVLTGNESAAEIEYLINKRKRDMAGANETSKTSELAEGFSQFRNQMNEMTGNTPESLNNLLMMRTAATLLTGKTTQPGLKGFADVAGQALGSTADMMIGLKMKQQESDMKLAQAYLKMKQEKAKGAGMLTTGDKTVRVTDPSVPGGFRNVRVSLGKDNKFYQRIMNPDGTQGFVQANFTGTDVKRNDEKLNKALMGLEDNRRGGKMVEFVIENASAGGSKAALGLLAEDTLGTFDFFAGGNVGGDTSVIDDQIRMEMNKNTEKGLFGGKDSEKLIENYNEDLEEARKNGAKEVEKQLKKAGIVAKNFRPTEEDLRKYTRLALIEQRMKYIVANANKSEDRLTQKDIDNAAKRTQIIKYIASPRTIRLNYEQLRQEFGEKAGTYLNQYKLNGGDEDFIINNFMDIPGVKMQYDQKNEQFQKSQVVQNSASRRDILNTIPIAGG
jgi:hypothetical protein